RGNFGNCLYAAQTYNSVPAADGRRIQIGWMRVDLPGMPFNQMMSFPVEFTLRKTDEGLRLFANPAREIEKLHGAKYVRENLLVDRWIELKEPAGVLWHVLVEFEPGNAKDIAIEIRDRAIGYDVMKQVLTCDDAAAPVKLRNRKLRLEILVDRASIE